MKLDKICRTCLMEKANLKPIFGACVANMLMTLASVQVLEGDGLPHQICTQCLQNINRAYSFKQLCEKSDAELRQYLNSLQPSIQTIINDVKSDIFGPEDVMLPQASIFSDIFNDATTHSLIVDNFDPNPSSVVSDLAETMQSLQTIAEQCLPDTWDSDAQLVDSVSDASACLNIDGFSLQSLDFKCQFCNCEFKDEWLLAEHIKSHTAQTKYYCSVCSKVFDSNNDLNKHFIEHCLESNDLQQFVNQSSSQKKINNCEICDRSFNDFQTLRKHLRDCHFLFDSFMDGAKQHGCTVCGKRFKQNKHLQMHMRVHTGEKPHMCNICGKQFAFFNSLHKHKSVHSGRQFSCQICGKVFNQSSNLNAHLLLHTGPSKKYSCTVCQKAFTTNKNLEVHMASHTGIKPFICTGCPQAFATNAQLKRHLRVHSGEKPYTCWQCGKAFRRKETRDIHQRYHTGERPFSCSICQEKFVAGNHLKAHLKTHSADKPNFECMTCLKKFGSMRALRFHIMTHTGEKPHQCSFCNKQFVQPAGLKLHLKNVHNKA